MELGELFFQALQEIYQGVFEVMPRKDLVRVWTHFKKPFREGEAISYSQCVPKFVAKYVFPFDRKKCFMLLSRETLFHFMLEHETIKKVNIRFQNSQNTFSWYEIQLVRIQDDSDRILILFKDSDRYCRNEILHAACRGDYDYVVYISCKDHLLTLYPNKDIYLNAEVYCEDYEERVIHFIYDFVSPDKINETLEALSLENVEKQLQKSEKYEYYTTIFVNQEKLHKKYRFVYLNDEKNVILMARTDVTEQLERQLHEKEAIEYAYNDAVRANQSKMEFLSKMSHDIRTPLNAILGMATIAGVYIDNQEKVINSLNEIVKSGQYLTDMVSDILDFSRMESGKMHLQIDSVSMKVLLRETVDMFRTQMNRKKISLQTDLSELKDDWFLGDEKKLSQILSNILGNAVKYTEENGTIKIAVSSVQGMKKGFVHYQISVEDNGIGMDEEFLKESFAPFRRADNAVEKGISGTGLGMSIAENLIHLMNGTITVKSKKGVGTTFFLYFRCEKCDPQWEREEHGNDKIQRFR